LREQKSMTVALVSSNLSYFPNAFFSSGSISPLAAIAEEGGTHLAAACDRCSS
jgi:hypothetical protein